MAGKLPGPANVVGGTIRGTSAKPLSIIGATEVDVAEDTARLPSYYRALAVTAAADYIESKRIARATISGPGAAVAGRLKVRAPVDTAEPVVQKYEADDGTWRRKSTDESTWSGWIKQFDEDNKPAVADISDAGTAASQDIQNDGNEGTGVPTIDGDNVWTGINAIQDLRLVGMAEMAIVSGVGARTRTLMSPVPESGTVDDLATITDAGGFGSYPLLILYVEGGNVINVKHGTGNIRCHGAADIAMNQGDALMLFFDGSNWRTLAPLANNNTA